jgi:hypothetical protein
MDLIDEQRLDNRIESSTPFKKYGAAAGRGPLDISRRNEFVGLIGSESRGGRFAIRIYSDRLTARCSSNDVSE